MLREQLVEAAMGYMLATLGFTRDEGDSDIWRRDVSLVKLDAEVGIDVGIDRGERVAAFIHELESRLEETLTVTDTGPMAVRVTGLGNTLTRIEVEGAQQDLYAENGAFLDAVVHFYGDELRERLIG